MKRVKILIIAFILCFGLTITIQSNSIDAKKADVVQRNKQKKVVKIIKYHNNDKVAYEETMSYFKNGKISTRGIIKRNTNGAKTSDYKRTNYSNGKAKQVTILSNYANGGYKKKEIKKYRSNGKRTFVEYVTRNNSHVRTETKQYYYNKKGQLKTNKNGSAKRVIYKYYNNNKISSKTTHKYNTKGKLYGKVVNTKSYLKNKPKITFKNPSQADLNKVGDEIIVLVNQERSKKGLNKLMKNNTFTNAANLRSKELTKLFSHTRPDGSLCFTVAEGVSGENIAMSGGISYKQSGNYYVIDTKAVAKSIYSLWYNSPGHYANMTNSSFKEIGVGIHLNDNGIYATQLFGK